MQLTKPLLYPSRKLFDFFFPEHQIFSALFKQKAMFIKIQQLKIYKSTGIF